MDTKTGLLVPAHIYTEITPGIFRVIANTWDDSKEQSRQALKGSGTALPGNDAWDWEQKARTTSADLHRFLAVATEEHIQGMMMLATVPQPSRRVDRAQDPLMYIEYLESAPWNLYEYVGKDVRYRGIGSALLAAAVDLSVEAGCNGRLALHSLPGARGFYEKAGFENLGYDPQENLDWFELPGVIMEP